jgi:hypothetical protein
MHTEDNEQKYDLHSIAGRQYNDHFGSLRIGKGKFNATSLFYSWDAVPYCRETDCPIVEMCTYAKGPTIKCQIHSQFLKSLSIILYRNFANVLDEPRLYRVGLHMMPLYKMLCKLLIEEHAIQNAIYTDDKGIRRANPVFKEIRDTLQAISKEWRALGLSGASAIGVPDPFLNGDPNFHASLESDRPRKITRRKRGGAPSQTG